MTILKSGLRPDFYRNLEIIRNAAQNDSIPFWAFALTVPHGQYPPPVQSHLRMQVFSLLAYGARGIQYFSFATPSTNRWNFDDALIDPSGQPTPSYYLVKKLNAQIRKIGPLLLGLESIGIFHSDPVPEACSGFYNGYPITKIDGQDILAGFFQNEKKQKYILLVNKNYNFGSKPRVYFSGQVNKIKEIATTRRKPQVIEWKNPSSQKNCFLLFKAGEGRMFRIYN